MHVLDECDADTSSTTKTGAQLAALKDHVGDSHRSFRFLEGAYIADLLKDLPIAKMYAVRSLPLDHILSPAELAQQEALAESIVKDLVKRERTDDLSAPARQLKLAAEHQGQPGNDPGRDGNTCGGCISTGRPPRTGWPMRMQSPASCARDARRIRWFA